MSYSNPAVKNPFAIEVDLIAQNRESNRKTHQEKIADETNAVKSSQEDVKTRKSNGADIVTKRQKLARALAAKKGKNKNKSTAKALYSKQELQALAKVNNLLSQAKIQAAKENWGEPDVDMNRVDLLQQLFKPKNLRNSKASPETLAKAVSYGKQISRTFRKSLRQIIPQTIDAAASAFASQGIDLSSPPAKSSQSIDSAVLSAMLAALSANDVLQQLGIQSQETNTEIQESYSSSVVSKGNDIFNHNKEALSEQHHESCKEKTMKILGDIVGAICIVLDMPEVGIPIILASNGLIQKWIVDVAKAMHIPPYALKSIIMAVTIIVAIAAAPESGGSSLSAIAGVVGKCALVAGLTGWVTDTVGVAATGSLDESKYPAWVQWAGMAITIALGLAGGMESIVNGVRSVMTGISNAATSAMDAVTSLFVDAEETAGSTAQEIELADMSAPQASEEMVEESDATNAARSADESAVNDASTQSAASVSKLRMILAKILKKFLDAKDAMFAAEEASDVSQVVRGGVSNAEKAEAIMGRISRAVTQLQRVSRVLLVGSTGAETVVSVQLAQIKRDLAECLKETSKLIGETQLIESFLTTLNAAIKDSQNEQKEYAKESADEIKVISEIISGQRRGQAIVASA